MKLNNTLDSSGALISGQIPLDFDISLIKTVSEKPAAGGLERGEL